MFKYPGIIQPEFDTQNVVSNVDMVSTVLSLLGLDKGSLPGINALDEDQLNNRQVVFAEAYDHDISNVDAPSESLLYKIAIEKTWKLILPNNEMVEKEATTRKENIAGYYANTVQLFNLAEDPLELDNVAADYPEEVARLTKEIENWWQLDD